MRLDSAAVPGRAGGPMSKEGSAMEAYAGWAIVELMGHRRLAGQVREVDQYGGKMLRLDVPAVDDQPAFTQFYGCSSIYCLSPASEEIALALVKRTRQPPVQRYELALPPAATPRDAEVTDNHDEGGPEPCKVCGMEECQCPGF
jgi:hypothetical protein